MGRGRRRPDAEDRGAGGGARTHGKRGAVSERAGHGRRRPEDRQRASSAGHARRGTRAAPPVGRRGCGRRRPDTEDGGTSAGAQTCGRRGAVGAGRGRRCGADGSTGHGLAGSKWGTGEGQQRMRGVEDEKTWQLVDDKSTTLESSQCAHDIYAD